jgi:3-oxoacyl-[acyl-carrier protein] reductase
MTKELAGRVAIVTGAGRNIGRGIALALAGGAAVVVNARSNLREAEAVASEIERAGSKAFGVTADVADVEAVQRWLRPPRRASAVSTSSSTTRRCAPSRRSRA